MQHISNKVVLLLFLVIMCVTCFNGNSPNKKSKQNVRYYNSTIATTLVTYAGAAYCCGGLGAGVSTWSCRACKSQPGLRNISVLYDSLTNANGFIGYNPIGTSFGTPFIIISFSGTDPLSIKNWIDDIDTFKEKYPYCNNTCKVHKGFYNTYLSIQGQLLQTFYALHTQYPSAAVHITGHSLGAALAVHATLDLIRLFSVESTVYTFGQPRVGDKRFSEYFSDTTHGWRDTHWRDPVPHLPPKSFGFHHTPVEVFYSKNNVDYKVCDGSGEDKHCSDKFLVDIDVFDHLNYLGFDFTTNYLSCKL